MTILYISYDGLMEPLGQSQVYQYLKRLAQDQEIYLVSFEKRRDWLCEKERLALQREARSFNIIWIPLKYHKRPTLLATAFDVLQGVFRCSSIVATKRIRLVHARSYVPAFISLFLKWLFGVRFIFDMRGFWVDERADLGQWSTGSRIYTCIKTLEKQFILKADKIVSLTRAGVAAMERFSYLQGTNSKFAVITTCTDLNLFKPSSLNKSMKEQEFVLGYVGSASKWHLFDEVLLCFKYVMQHKNAARLLVLNRDHHEFIRERLCFHGIPSERVELITVVYQDVPKYMQRMHAGIFFYRPTFSKLATAPTRLGEFLGCGVPCLANAGIGDVEAVLEGEKVGVVMHQYSDVARQNAVIELLELADDMEVRLRCSLVAKKLFSLDNGVKVYRELYQELLTPSSGRQETGLNRGSIG